MRRDFWSRVDRSAGDDAFWPWTGAKSRDGYGRVRFRGKDAQTHRVAFVLGVHELEPGQIVRHKVCDNPPCCNPRHLRSGTRGDNMRDAIERSRHTHGARIWSARLSEADAETIRAAFAQGTTRYELAERFKVSHRQICHIVNGKRWKRTA